LETPAEPVFMIVMKERQQAFQHRIPHLANSHAKRRRYNFKSHTKNASPNMRNLLCVSNITNTKTNGGSIFASWLQQKGSLTIYFRRPLPIYFIIDYYVRLLRFIDHYLQLVMRKLPSPDDKSFRRMSIEQAPPSERYSPLHSKIYFSKRVCCISHWWCVHLFFSFVCFFMPKFWQSVLFKIEIFIPTFLRFCQYRRLVGLYCIIWFGILSSAKLSKSFIHFLLYYFFCGRIWRIRCSLVQS
jgi:hypothetical protein